VLQCKDSRELAGREGGAVLAHEVPTRIADGPAQQLGTGETEHLEGGRVAPEDLPFAPHEQDAHVEVLDQPAQPSLAFPQRGLAALLLLEGSGDASGVALEGTPHEEDGEEADGDEEMEEVIQSNRARYACPRGRSRLG
jgi:hypothetical protein